MENGLRRLSLHLRPPAPSHTCSWDSPLALTAFSYGFGLKKIKKYSFGKWVMIDPDRSTLGVQLNPEQKALFTSLGQRKTYRDGQVIFPQGDNTPVMSVVISGQVKLYRRFPDGRVIMEAILKHGQHFDDSVALDMAPRLHGSVAAGETVIDHYNPAALEQLLAHHDILRVFFNIATYRVCELVQLLDDSRILPSEMRLGKLLLYMFRLMPGEGGRIECLQEDLATRLGISGVTLAKSLTKLKQAGMIETGYRHVTVLDPERLRQWIAERASG